jgi:hypothetical protein
MTLADPPFANPDLLDWKRQLHPRICYLARDQEGVYQIVEKGWFYCFVPDGTDEHTNNKWKAAASLEDAKRGCEAHRRLRRARQQQGGGIERS